MRVIKINLFEIGDIVEFVDDYRGWRKGDKATVKQVHFENGDITRRHYIDLVPFNVTQNVDQGTIPDYFLKLYLPNNYKR